MLNLAFSLVFLFSLLMCNTNRVYLSPLWVVVAACMAPTLISIHKLEKFQAAFLGFLGYIVLSTLLYHPQSFLNFGFYRYDGNIFISYGALIFFSLVHVRIHGNKMLYHFIRLSTLIQLSIFTIYFFRVFIRTGYSFNGLFRAMNAAGGFFSILACIAFAFLIKYRNKSWALIFMLNMVFLLFTRSRGSILGLIMAIACWYFIRKGKPILVTLMIISLSVLTIGLTIKFYPAYKSVGHFMEYFDESERETLTTKKANIYIRLLHDWPRAWELFLHSPLFGTGFGSLNDTPYNLDKDCLVCFNQPRAYIFSDSHAHHTYLHFLGELGLIGILLFAVFWYLLYRYIIESPDSPLQTACQLVYYALTTAAFTEHRITTPAMALPFCYLIGMLIWDNQSRKNNELNLLAENELPLEQ
jgi:O-antigen ligase